MNRRDFLKLAAAVVASRAAPALPVPAAEPEGRFITLDVIRRTVETLNKYRAPQPFTLFVHPNTLSALIDLSARERWKVAYRQARVEVRELSREMMESARKNGIGRIESVRFYESKSLPT